MEACGGAQHWASEIQGDGSPGQTAARQGRERLRHWQQERPARCPGDLDGSPAAARQAVAIKTEEQQAMLALHRMRSQLVKFRTAQINGLRGLLTEYGDVPQGKAGVRKGITDALARMADRLPAMVIDTLREQWARIARWMRLPPSNSASSCGSRATKPASASPRFQASGLSPATGSGGHHGDAKNPFKSGREFAAFAGLVPRQTGTGGRIKLLGISKRGDTCERC